MSRGKVLGLTEMNASGGGSVETVKITQKVTALATPVPIPGIGFLPVNAFVIESSGAPILVDTCVTQPSGDFVKALSTIVDPNDIKSIWLTHPDRDHTGGLLELLQITPDARVFTTFTSVGHLLAGPEPIPLDRVRIVNPGDRVDVGDREVQAIRPPLYDNPGTVGFFDAATGVLVSADCFGGPTGTFEDALIPDVAAIPKDQRTASQLAWGSADSPWVHSVDERKFAASLDEVRRLDPQLVLSTHLPAIHGGVEEHLEVLARLPGSPPAPSPDQATLDTLLAQFELPAP